MLRCIRCAKAGDSQEAIQGTCIDKQTIGCPYPVEVVPGKDIVLACRAEACGKVFSFPAARIPDRHIPTEVSCMFTPCAIMVVNPASVADEVVRKASRRGKAEG